LCIFTTKKNKNKGNILHLIERYALSTGLKIDLPSITDLFYPIVADKYVVFHTSSKDNLRDYDYWEEVKEMLQPLFNKYNLKTVQIGLEKDPAINCNIDVRGKTSINQMANVVRNCSYFIGVDSFPAHLAGFYDRKMLAIYSNSYSASVRPYWGSRDNQKIVETHRPNGEKPSFSFNEKPKTINRLKPDEIASDFSELIEKDFESEIPNVLFVGEFFKKDCIDFIPSSFSPFKLENVNVRMDLHFNEKVLGECLKYNDCEITTNKPISKEILKSKKIRHVNYLTESFETGFVDDLVELGLPNTLMCSKKENLPRERAKLFDHNIHFFSEDNLYEKNKKKFGKSIEGIKIRSAKKVLIGDKVFESRFDAFNRENEYDFYVDLEWLFVYDVGQ
tara:strand:+ start:640 stop:1812 length:1173 start_codon:yes stop_codon:yes gene_type:complete